MVAVRLDALEAVESLDGSVVLVPRGLGRPRPGEPVAWCAVTAVAPVVADRAGRVGADGLVADHVRLGILEQHLGEDAIEVAVAASQARQLAPGEQPARRRRRIMTLALAARLVLLMTLLPEASYVETMARLVGPLGRLPWARGWQVPSSTVVTAWRRLLGPGVMATLFARVAGPIVSPDEPGGAWRGLRVCAIDGFQVNVPDSPANRDAFGSSGTSGDGPFPQVRTVLATARAGRALLAAAVDASHVGELPLAQRLLEEHPELFTAGDVYVLDRYFGSYDLLHAMHQQGAHVLVRMKSTARLPVTRRLGDGEYLSHLRLRDGRHLRVRVVEYDVTLPDGTTSELFCVATTLLDPVAYPKAEIADLYLTRWSASETTIGENKTTVTDAGPSRGPNLRSHTPDLVRQELWAWLTATQLVRHAAHAAARTTTGVSTDQISFTTTRREATRSITHALVSATTSPAARAAAHGQAARAILTNQITPSRDRHSPRQQKWRPRFPHTTTTKTTTHGPLTPKFQTTTRTDTS